MNILFICTGNINRSPAAETIMMSISPKNIHVDSAALSDDKIGRITLKPMREALKKKGFTHYLTIISKPITKSLFNWADYIVYMTPTHRRQLVARFGESDKYLNLARFIHKNEIKDLDEHDPKYFENTVKDIYHANINLLKWLKRK